MEIIEGDTEMIGVGVKFFEWDPFKSLEATEGILYIGDSSS